MLESLRDVERDAVLIADLLHISMGPTPMPESARGKPQAPHDGVRHHNHVPTTAGDRMQADSTMMEFFRWP